MPIYMKAQKDKNENILLESEVIVYNDSKGNDFL